MELIFFSSSSVTVTFTGPIKPCALAEYSFAASAGVSAVSASAPPAFTSAAICFRASRTAFVVIVAPEIASMSPASTGMLFPMNWFRNDSSFAVAPSPGVSANSSSPISMELIFFSSSSVTVTFTGPIKPCALAEYSFGFVTASEEAASDFPAVSFSVIAASS